MKGRTELFRVEAQKLITLFLEKRPQDLLSPVVRALVLYLSQTMYLLKNGALQFEKMSGLWSWVRSLEENAVFRSTSSFFFFHPVCLSSS